MDPYLKEILPEGSKIVQMEENITRAINLRWKDYDIAGDIYW